MINPRKVPAFFQEVINKFSTEGVGSAIRHTGMHLKSPYKEIFSNAGTYCDNMLASITKENIIDFFYSLRIKKIVIDRSQAILQFCDTTSKRIPIFLSMALEKAKKTIEKIFEDPKKTVTALAIIFSIIATVVFLAIAASYGLSIYHFYQSCNEYFFKFNGTPFDNINNGLFGNTMFFRGLTLSYLLKSLPFLAVGITIFSSAFFIKQKEDRISIAKTACFSEDESVNTLKKDESWSHIPTSTYLAAKLFQKPIDHNPIDILDVNNDYSFSFEEFASHTFLPPIHTLSESPSLLIDHMITRVKQTLDLILFVAFQVPRSGLLALYHYGLNGYNSILDVKERSLNSQAVRRFHERNHHWRMSLSAQKKRTYKRYKNPFGRANRVGEALYTLYPIYWTLSRTSLKACHKTQDCVSAIGKKIVNLAVYTRSSLILIKDLSMDGLQLSWLYTKDCFQKAPVTFAQKLNDAGIAAQDAYKNSVDSIVHNIHDMQKDIGIVFLLIGVPFLTISGLAAIPAILGTVLGNIGIALMMLTKASVYADAFLVVCSLFLSLYTASLVATFSNDFRNQIMMAESNATALEDTLITQQLNTLQYQYTTPNPSSILFSNASQNAQQPSFILEGQTTEQNEFSEDATTPLVQSKQVQELSEDIRKKIMSRSLNELAVEFSGLTKESTMLSIGRRFFNP